MVRFLGDCCKNRVTTNAGGEGRWPRDTTRSRDTGRLRVCSPSKHPEREREQPLVRRRRGHRSRLQDLCEPCLHGGLTERRSPHDGVCPRDGSGAAQDRRACLFGIRLGYFINYSMADGWSGGGFGKVFRIGNQTMNFNTQVFYNAVRPDDFPSANFEWRFQLNFLFPK